MRLFFRAGYMIGVSLVGGMSMFGASSAGGGIAEGVNHASDFDDMGLVISMNSFDSQNPSYNDLGGAYGPLMGYCVSLAFDRNITHAGSPASLKIDFTDLEVCGYAGIWNSLINSRPNEYPEYTLNITNWDLLRFYVRGSEAFADIFDLKIEIKEAFRENDINYAFNHTAYKYILFDGADTNWTEVVLTNDFTNPSCWSLNRYPPDPTKIKELAFVLEARCNPSSGSFYIDDVAFIDSGKPAQPITESSSDKAFIHYLLENNFRFFLHSVHPQTGLVLDRSSFPDLATIAGVGFGLSCWPLAAQGGLISRDQAFGLASNVLTTLANAPMGSTRSNDVSTTGQIGVNGFFYHFLDPRSATRAVQTNAMGYVISASELSPIDTAICAFGVIACRQAMTVTNHYTAQQESRIASLADAILSRIDWPFLLHPSGAMYTAWKPEPSLAYLMPHPSGIGYVASTTNGPYIWDYSTDEVLLIAIAGMAAPKPAHRLSESFIYSWLRVMKSFAGYDVVVTWPGAAFTYQFANLWLPLRQLPPDSSGMDWWLNAYKAARCSYAFSMDPAVCAAYSTFDSCSFGPTACEDPSGRYRAFGATPAGEITNRTCSDRRMVRKALTRSFANDPDFINGTLAPYGAACFIEFMPEETLRALRHYFLRSGIVAQLLRLSG